MKDQVDALNQLGIQAAYVNSSLGHGEIAERLSVLKEGGYKLFYVTPERLTSPDFIRVLSRIHILSAIDELTAFHSGATISGRATDILKAF
jgi:ATP-dependent DNA helicase RecQ